MTDEQKTSANLSTYRALRSPEARRVVTLLASFPNLHVTDIAEALRTPPDQTRRLVNDLKLRGYIRQSDSVAFTWISTGIFDPDEGGEWPEERGPVRVQ